MLYDTAESNRIRSGREGDSGLSSVNSVSLWFKVVPFSLWLSSSSLSFGCGYAAQCLCGSIPSSRLLRVLRVLVVTSVPGSLFSALNPEPRTLNPEPQRHLWVCGS